MTTAPFTKRYFTLPRNGIGLLRFLLESYDGLAFARTLDPAQGLVEIAYAPGRARDAEALLAELETELHLQEVPAPEGVAPL